MATFKTQQSNKNQFPNFGLLIFLFFLFAAGVAIWHDYATYPKPYLNTDAFRFLPVVVTDTCIYIYRIRLHALTLPVN